MCVVMMMMMITNGLIFSSFKKVAYASSPFLAAAFFNSIPLPFFAGGAVFARAVGDLISLVSSDGGDAVGRLLPLPPPPSVRHITSSDQHIKWSHVRANG
jgi:hypothetical protein